MPHFICHNQMSPMKMLADRRDKDTSLYCNFHIYRPISVKFGMRDLRIITWSTDEFHEPVYERPYI